MEFNKEVLKFKQSDFDFILKNGKRSNEIAGYKVEGLIYCSYGFLKFTLPELIKDCKFEELVIQLLQDINYNPFYYEIEKVTVTDFFKFICFITDELKAIGDLEKNYLSGDSDIDLQVAGINELNQFGDLNIVDNLAKGDITKHEEIKKLRYHVVFDKLYKGLKETEIQKKVQKIKSSKTKGKSK